MKINPIGSNQTLVTMENGVEILFSYQTAVAGFVSGIGYIRTNEKYSTTTSKHINAYCGKGNGVPVTPAELVSLSNTGHLPLPGGL